MISIKKVEGRRDLYAFIRFNYHLYKGNAYAVPDFLEDMQDTFNRRKNAAFEFCEADLFLAYKDKKLVGRVAAIINHKANKTWQTKNVRFGWIDFIDDIEVLKALLDTVEQLGYKRTIVIFQPHTYSRTKALFDDFVEQLRRPDVTILAEIYAAREQNTIGISSRDIAEQIPNSMYFDSFEEIVKTLRWTAAPGDLILTVGAGNIYKVGEMLLDGKNSEK